MNVTSRSELFAEELALSLNDRASLQLYESFAQRYPESFLRRILNEVLEVPAERIKKSRGALFTYLLKKYANQSHNNNRD